MAATKNCAACNNLQEQSADFVQNGVTTNVCTSLKNDTGFSASNGNNDCTDLDYANDCLIGNMEDEVDAYEVCDWKEFMKKFIHNLWTVLKAMICAICGIWTNIHNLWTKVNKHDCIIEYLNKGFSFAIGEEDSDNSYVVAGKGVSFLARSGESAHSTDVRIIYIGGALAYTAGGLVFHTNNFEEMDNTKVWNFDNGSEIRHSYNRTGNSVWGDTGDTVSGSELVYEVRIKKSAYPEIKSIYGLFGVDANVGGFHLRVQAFNEGAWAYGQHGSCDGETGQGSDGRDDGHKVPSGWYYVQVRMTYIDELVKSGNNTRGATPIAIMGMRFNTDEIKC